MMVDWTREGQEEELLFLIQKPGTVVLVPSQLCKFKQDIYKSFRLIPQVFGEAVSL